MPKNANWWNLKYSASPEVASLWKKINDDPFSSCFFLSSLYDAKLAELKQSHPHFFLEPCPHEVTHKRQELVLTNMYMHIKRIEQHGLRVLKKEAENEH